jgi:hypothetical protein
MKEATIGTLPWFAGVFWLLLSVVSHLSASWFFIIGDKSPMMKSPAWQAAWRMIRVTNWCNKMAYRCALEAGAKE